MGNPALTVMSVWTTLVTMEEYASTEILLNAILAAAHLVSWAIIVS